MKTVIFLLFMLCLSCKKESTTGTEAQTIPEPQPQTVTGEWLVINTIRHNNDSDNIYNALLTITQNKDNTLTGTFDYDNSSDETQPLLSGSKINGNSIQFEILGSNSLVKLIYTGYVWFDYYKMNGKINSEADAWYEGNWKAYRR
jgi:hypothetical protein